MVTQYSATLCQRLVLSMSRYEMGGLRERGVACLTSDRQGSNFSLHETTGNRVSCSNAGLNLVHRLRRWPSIKSALEQSILS